jgi:hypothetical protein
MPRMSSPSLSGQKVITNKQPTNYYDDLFDFARVYTWLIGESERQQNSAQLKVNNVNVNIDVDNDNDDVFSYLMSRRDVRLRRHELKSKKPNSQINLKKKK